MGMLGTAMNAVSVTMGLAQTYRTAQYNRAEAKMNADTLETQAARKELEAEEALAIGRLNQAEQAVKGRQTIAANNAAFAHNGVQMGSGSTLDAAADTAAWNEYERQKIQYEAELDNWGLRYDAALLRQEAATVRAGAGTGSGLAPALGAGIKLSSLIAK